MNRIANNIVVGVLYVLSIGATVVGETWIYHLIGSVVEVAILLTIVRIAGTWRGRSAGGLASEDRIGTVGEMGLPTSRPLTRTAGDRPPSAP